MDIGPRVYVRFSPPPPIEIELQGPAKVAWKKWVENPTDSNEEALADAIYEQCEPHVISRSSIEEWDFT